MTSKARWCAISPTASVPSTTGARATNASGPQGAGRRASSGRERIRAPRTRRCRPGRTCRRRKPGIRTALRGRSSPPANGRQGSAVRRLAGRRRHVAVDAWTSASRSRRSAQLGGRSATRRRLAQGRGPRQGADDREAASPARRSSSRPGVSVGAPPRPQPTRRASEPRRRSADAPPRSKTAASSARRPQHRAKPRLIPLPSSSSVHQIAGGHLTRTPIVLSKRRPSPHAYGAAPRLAFSSCRARRPLRRADGRRRACLRDPRRCRSAALRLSPTARSG